MRKILNTIVAVVVMLFLCCPAVAKGKTEETKTIRVLAIGNSFSEDAVEHYLYEMAEEAGVEIIIGNAYRGGQSLEGHWNDVVEGSNTLEYRKLVSGMRISKKNQSLARIVRDEPWDIITFQQVSQYSGLPDTYEPYLTMLIAYVQELAKNTDVVMGLHQTWAYAADSEHDGFANYGRDQQRMYEAIVAAVDNAVAFHDELTFIVPSGTAIQNARTSSLGDTMNRDGYHLDYGIGRYVAACTWLEVVTGVNPMKINFHPEDVDEAAAVIARRAAHKAVQKPGKVSW